MTIRSVCRSGCSSPWAPVAAAKGPSSHESTTSAATQPCMMRTSSEVCSSLWAMNQATTARMAAQSNSGPALPPHTADTRYSNGNSLLP